jgi:hypothetical protein
MLQEYLTSSAAKVAFIGAGEACWGGSGDGDLEGGGCCWRVPGVESIAAMGTAEFDGAAGRRLLRSWRGGAGRSRPVR